MDAWIELWQQLPELFKLCAVLLGFIAGGHRLAADHGCQVFGCFFSIHRDGPVSYTHLLLRAVLYQDRVGLDIVGQGSADGIRRVLVDDGGKHIHNLGGHLGYRRAL